MMDDISKFRCQIRTTWDTTNLTALPLLEGNQEMGAEQGIEGTLHLLFEDTWRRERMA